METILIANAMIMWVVLLLNLFLTLGLIRYRNAKSVLDSTRTPEPYGPTIGTLAPPFIAETLAGNAITLDNLLGDELLLIAFGPNCETCRENLHHYEEVGDSALKSGVKVFLISDSNLNDTQNFVEEFQLTLPTLVAPVHKNHFFTDYNFLSVPGYCLIDEKGIVRSSGYPSLILNDWKNLVQYWQNSLP